MDARAGLPPPAGTWYLGLRALIVDLSMFARTKISAVSEPIRPSRTSRSREARVLAGITSPAARVMRKEAATRTLKRIYTRLTNEKGLEIGRKGFTFIGKLV